MGKPLSPDRMFDFPVDEPEPHPAYDFFAFGPLPGYASNPDNNNKWIEKDVPLLGEIGVVSDESMVGLIIDEIVELIVEAEEQVIAPMVDMDEDIVMLFGDDDSEGFDEEELVKKVIQVSDAEVAAGISIGEISPRVFAVDGQVQVMASQMVHAADIIEQIGTQVEQGQHTVTRRDEVIAGLTQQVQALQVAVHQRDSRFSSCRLWFRT
uniref:Uncharacterized protein n=1 Tax=Tanacetum cinerariifolium TaxID=118510 RepID=A0A6L2J5L7_TANCI|nr:hypothetical protein [Tanacetum cinerariifolium]